MGKLKYVVLSDLHLGAHSSLFTHIGPNRKARYRTKSATLCAFAAALHETVAVLADEADPPVLVLMGDVLDLGISKTGQVAAAFLPFVDALFPAGNTQRFASDIVFVPGNHDHHLWRVAQDEFFMDNVTQFAARKDEYIPSPIEHTQLFREGNPDQGTARFLRCSLLSKLIQTRDHLKGHAAKIAYPNFGLIDADHKRSVVLHHGHYVDAMYRALSRLNRWLNDADVAPQTIAQIERENGPWVDFLWSNLGSTGEVAHDVRTLYATMLDARASHRFARMITDRVLAQLSASLGISADFQIPNAYGLTVRGLISGLLDVTVGRAAESQRNGYREVLSHDEIADLKWYIGTPLAIQMERQGMGKKERDKLTDFSFIFGHTHKPFQDQLSIAPFRRPVSIYNTGGWVMDGPTTMPCQGAAAVLIDEHLNVASLRLFNDPVNGELEPVHAAGVGGFHDRENQLLTTLRETLVAQGNLWEAFSSAIHAAMNAQADIAHARAGMEHVA
jgi:UDP-2,3-diacylglucosamine pyrophosphatase LpxH